MTTRGQHAAPSTPHIGSRRFGRYNRCVHRFFAPLLDPGDDIVMLPREEADHLTRVLRLGVGDRVSVFDGPACRDPSVPLATWRSQ